MVDTISFRSQKVAVIVGCVTIVALAAHTVAGAETVTNSIGMKLVLIPAGDFMMGSPQTEVGRDGDEGPQHRVRITKAF